MRNPKKQTLECEKSIQKIEQAGAELCQAQFKLELGGFCITSYFALIGVWF
jgi:hypothetical protein